MGAGHDLFDSISDWKAEPTVVVPPFGVGFFFADRFRIERLLGSGGMGAVYEATDLTGESRVALKVMPRDRSPDPELQERFRREGRILASLSHPGIVAIRDIGYAPDGTPWIAMELLEGETLHRRVRREGAQSPQDLLPIVQMACAALEVAHERGVIHRDLKPDNLFLPSTGPTPVKLLDFGLSLHAGSAKVTRTGAVIGTPRYMAPEQIRSAHGADGRVDVYAMGVILYEMLTGKSPFAASDRGQLLGAVLTGRVRPLDEVRPDLPFDVVDVVERAMAPNRDDRYETPAALAEALITAVRMPSMTSIHPSRSSRPSLSPRQSKTPAPRRSRSRTILLGVLLLSAAIAAGIVLRHILG